MKKTLKKRAFISSIAMLIVSAIVLTSSTFAWFAMATQVSVDTMQLNIASADGITFSANTTNFTTSLTYADLANTQSSAYRYGAYEGNTNNMLYDTATQSTSGSLAPLSCPGPVARTQYPTFYKGSMDKDNKLTVTKITSDPTSTAGEVGLGFIAFDLFIKLAETKTVTWSADLSVNNGDSTDSLYAMRVGILTCGTVAEKADSTVISSVKPKLITDMKIWEMDNTTHTATSGVTTTNNAVVTRAFVTTISGYSMGTKHVFPSENVQVNQGDNGVLCQYATGDTEKTISCAAGVTRLRVYIWLEGQDVDCDSSIAGSVVNCGLTFSIPG